MLFYATKYQQSYYAELGVNSNTTSTAFSDLLTINANIGNGHIVALGMASCHNTLGAQTSIGIAIDGVLQDYSLAYMDHNSKVYNAGFCMAMFDRAPGAHVISLQWKTSAGGSADCNPGQAENATLLVYETYMW